MKDIPKKIGSVRLELVGVTVTGLTVDATASGVFRYEKQDGTQFFSPFMGLPVRLEDGGLGSV